MSKFDIGRILAKNV